MVDFLVSAGIKPTSTVSYNNLGNDDGKNLSDPSQFRSKEISKSNVVDDMVTSFGMTIRSLVNDRNRRSRVSRSSSSLLDLAFQNSTSSPNVFT